MGQLDVLKWLQEQRKQNKDWFSCNDIKEGLKLSGLTNGTIKGVNEDLFKLCTFNQIQFKGLGLWKHKKVFRSRL